MRTDPILKFLVVSLSFYGMSTFEGPMMSIKTVNALSHYTDWTIGHVHSGALAWVAMMTIGSMYSLIPRLFGRERDVEHPPHRCAFLDRDDRRRAVRDLDVDRGGDAGIYVAGHQSDGSLTYTLSNSSRPPIPSIWSACFAGCCS